MSATINCNKVCAFILLFISLSLAFRDPMNHLFESHKMETRSQRHYCGTNLVRALHFLCESYNKRSTANRHLNTISEDVSKQENEVISSEDATEAPKYSIALLKLLNDRNDMNHFHRHIRGVVDECCRRSCSTSQLSQYCGVTRVTTTAAPLIE